MAVSPVLASVLYVTSSVQARALEPVICFVCVEHDLRILVIRPDIIIIVLKKDQNLQKSSITYRWTLTE